MIKILNVIGSLNTGGAENNAMNILRFINFKKFSYYFLVFGDFEGDYEEEAKAFGADIIHMEEPKKNYKKFISEFRNLLKKEKFDVVHVNTLWNSGILLKEAKKEEVPIRICHSHSTQSSQKEGFIYKVYKKVMRKLILSSSTNLIACGREAGIYLYGQKQFQKNGQIIYNGVEDKKFLFSPLKRKEIRELIGISSETFVLGHVGRLAPVKNHSFIIEILNNLRDRISNVILILIGDGPELENLKEMVKNKGLEKKVFFLGNKNNVSEYLQALDVFVFPSFFEGFPVSLIEAQASGLPCLVSSNITEEARLTESTKYIELDNFEEWLNEIHFFANHKIDRAKVNVDTIKKNFAIDSIVEKWEELYEGNE